MNIYTQQNPKQGGALEATKKRDNTPCCIRLNAAGICVQINRFVVPGCVRSIELSSVAKLLHRPRWRARKGEGGKDRGP